MLNQSKETRNKKGHPNGCPSLKSDNIFIEVSKGRAVRPLIVVNEGKSTLTEKHLEQLEKNEIAWSDLINQGGIENIEADIIYDIDFEGKYKMVQDELKTLYWYDAKVFDIINSGESIAELSRRSGIRYYSLYNTYRKVKDRLKSSVIMSDEASGFSDPEFWGEYNLIEPEKPIETAIKKIQKQLKSIKN